MKKLVNKITKQVIDSVTGELIDQTEAITFVSKKEKEPFFLTYSKHMSVLYELTKFSTAKVLWKLLEMSEYNTNEVNVTAKRKQNIINELGISLPTYNNAIKELKDSGLISGDRGSFTINEEIHWRGDYKTREALLDARLRVTIEPEFN